METFWGDMMGIRAIPRQERDTSRRRKGRMQISDPTVIMSLVVGSMMLATQVILYVLRRGILLSFTASEVPRMENHPMCGITTGGQVSKLARNTFINGLNIIKFSQD